jgi:prevent-host-death family protein
MRKAKGDSKSPRVERDEVPAKAAKLRLGTLLSRVEFGGERIAITRRGKKVAALVSAQDLETLDGAA